MNLGVVRDSQCPMKGDRDVPDYEALVDHRSRSPVAVHALDEAG